MRWIYLSPHLDDAVLSAGGLIRHQVSAGIPVEIWTFMCGFPPAGELSLFAQALHQLWGFQSAEQAIQGRRVEDQKAAARLGAGTMHFDFLDCIYRRDPGGNWLYPEEVCVPPRPEDVELPGQIAEAISMRLLPDDVLVCQFAIGRHVDHTLVRRAAELLGRPLWYAADVPYVFNNLEELAPNTDGLELTAHALSETDLQAWPEAVLAYGSQLSGLFESDEAMRLALAGYAGDKRGISLWRAPADWA